MAFAWRAFEEPPSWAFEAIRTGEVDPRRTVLVQSSKGTIQDGMSAGSGAARILEYRDNRVVIETSSDAPGMLVLSDPWHPAWRVTVNDKSSEILKAFGVFRAVHLPSAGNHRIVMTYFPVAQYWGLVISIVAWMLLFGFLWMNRNRGDYRISGVITDSMGTQKRRWIVDNNYILKAILSGGVEMVKRRVQFNKSKRVKTDPSITVPAMVHSDVMRAEEPPQLVVFFVRLLIVAIAIYGVYHVVFRKDTPGQGKSVTTSIAISGPVASPLEVRNFTIPVTVDGFVARKGYQGWGENPGVNKSVRGQVLTVAGKTYDKGLGTHAPAEIQFELKGKAERFQCLVGADADGGVANQVVFVIQADGKVLFQSRMLTPTMSAVPVDLDVSGVQVLSLIAKGDGSWDHANFLDVRFTRASATATGEKDEAAGAKTKR
jgi:hypothetical protein